MVRYAVAALRGDLGRSLTVFLTLCLATISCGLLAGFTVNEQARTVGALDAAIADAEYHLIVRPSSSVRDTEKTQNLIGPHVLGEDYGGLTLDAWRKVAALADVEVAAPIAVLGVGLTQVLVPVPLGAPLDGQPDEQGRRRLVLRSMMETDAGPDRNIQDSTYAGVLSDPTDTAWCATPTAVTESNWGRSHPLPVSLRGGLFCGDFTVDGAKGSPWFHKSTMPLAIAAVDPDAERALRGDDFSRAAAVRIGSADNSSRSTGRELPIIPTLMVKHLEGQSISRVRLESVPWRHVSGATGGANERVQKILEAPDATVIARKEVSMSELYQDALGAVRGRDEALTTDAPNYDEALFVTQLLQRRDPVTTPGPDGALLVQPVAGNESAYANRAYPNSFVPVPGSAFVRDARSLRGMQFNQSRGASLVALDPVGSFEPTPSLNAKLGTLNPAGYTALTVAAKIPLDALPVLQNFRATIQDDDNAPAINAAAPITAIRVRVHGVTGADDTSAERLRLAASKIRELSGASVDIVAGAADTPVRVSLPAGPDGARAEITEHWLRKGVVLAIREAVDRKSALLLMLVLAVTTAVLALVSYSGVAAQADTYRTLAQLGWRPGRVATLVLMQQSLVGLAAGLVAVTVVLVLAPLFSVQVHWYVAGGLVPLATVLPVVATLIPAALAAQEVPPMQRRLRQRRRSLGTSSAQVGVALLAARPGRSVLAGALVAACVACVASLLMVQLVFSGGLVGTVLGESMAMEVRGPDLIALALLGVLSIVAVYALVHLGAIEDRGDLSVLAAIGWRPTQILRVLMTQAALLAGVGACLGVGLGLWLIHSFTGTLEPSSASVIVAFGVVYVALAVTAPVYYLRAVVAAPHHALTRH